MVIQYKAIPYYNIQDKTIPDNTKQHHRIQGTATHGNTIPDTTL